MIRIKTIIATLLLPLAANAQGIDEEEIHSLDLLRGVEYKAEAQASLSDGNTPLWLNANRYGLSSLDSFNGYLRGQLRRPLATDSLRRWGIGYGVDLAVATGFTSNLVVQQAYVEGRWLNAVLTIGSKERQPEMKNAELSSGAQTLGINARPIPQIWAGIPEYWAVPLTNGWFRLKGHVAYGMTTDDNWQQDFTQKIQRYTENALYHSKAIYFKIGNEERYYPLSFEIGLEMACQFGGKSYQPNGDVYESESVFKSMVNALFPGGSDATDGSFKNTEGNHLGSYVTRLNYDEETWTASIYADQFFEDNSMMVHIANNGWGEGADANRRVKHRYFFYNLNDWMIGAEYKLKYSHLINGVVFEYLTTKYQGGPTYHDHTANLAEHYTGLDNYYNHNIQTGWQHWGQVIGNPLYRSPIYNDDGRIVVEDNRFQAFHLGICGTPNEQLHYRLLATYRKGFGTYYNIYPKPRKDVSVMAEATWRFSKESRWDGWSVRGAVGMDHGKWIGNNLGVQLTIAKQGLVRLRR